MDLIKLEWLNKFTISRNLQQTFKTQNTKNQKCSKIDIFKHIKKHKGLLDKSIQSTPWSRILREKLIFR